MKVIRWKWKLINIWTKKVYLTHNQYKNKTFTFKERENYLSKNLANSNRVIISALEEILICYLKIKRTEKFIRKKFLLTIKNSLI